MSMTAQSVTTETTLTTAEIAETYIKLKAEADAHYSALKLLEYELVKALRDEFPAEWARWQNGFSGFAAYGIKLPLKREYDIDKVRALLGEKYPELFTTEVKEVRTEKVDGKKLLIFWKDAAYSHRLSDTLKPPRVKFEIAKGAGM